MCRERETNINRQFSSLVSRKVKGFKVYKNFITDTECQQIIDSLNKQESDHLQNRYEIQDYDIPQSVLDKSQKILGDEKIIATRVQCYETGQNRNWNQKCIWISNEV